MKTINVLVIQSNDLQRRIFTMGLSKFNVNVFEAPFKEDAINILLRNDVDVVFLDSSYNDDVMFKLASEITEFKVRIYITTFDDDYELHNDLRHIITDVIIKPIAEETYEKIFTFDDETEFNIDEFTSFVDPSMQKIIIETFLEEQEEDHKKIVEAFKTKDTEEIYQIVHYLKSSFSYLKANKLFEKSKFVLDLCKRSKIAAVLNEEQDYIKQFETLVQEVKEYYKTLGSA